MVECDPYIELELKLAGINVVEKETKGEVPTKYIGELEGFTFERAWYYWIVKGNVPLELANEMYENPIGKKDVRVTGHCGCPAPEECARKMDLNGKELCNKSELDDIKSEKIKKALIDDPKLKWVDDKSKNGQLFVTSYHIDSWQGLKLFADTVKRIPVVQ